MFQHFTSTLYWISTTGGTFLDPPPVDIATVCRGVAQNKKLWASSSLFYGGGHVNKLYHEPVIEDTHRHTHTDAGWKGHVNEGWTKEHCRLLGRGRHCAEQLKARLGESPSDIKQSTQIPAACHLRQPQSEDQYRSVKKTLCNRESVVC